jgi:hypothetical protein
MRTLASLEGVLLIDNRCNEGVPDEVVVPQGLPPGAGRGIFEEACYTCSHCQAQVVKNRNRTRPRGFCKGCNKVICDACDARYHASAHQCVPFNAFAEEVRNAAARGDANPVAAAEFHFFKRLSA